MTSNLAGSSSRTPACPDEIIALAKSCIAKYQTFDEVCVTRAGCTVSSHCGPGTIGILFIRK